MKKGQPTGNVFPKTKKPKEPERAKKGGGRKKNGRRRNTEGKERKIRIDSNAETRREGRGELSPSSPVLDEINTTERNYTRTKPVSFPVITARLPECSIC